MSKRTLWRLISVILICLACGYFFVPLSKVKLGLDLRGGVHFMLEVQGHEALEADLRDTRDRLNARLAEKGFPSAMVKIDGAVLKIEGVPLEQKGSLEKQLASFDGYKPTWSTEGIVTLAQEPAHQAALKDDANKRAVQIVETRVNAFSVSEASVTQTGAEGNRIKVEIPGVSEAERDRVKVLLSTPGRLEMRMIAKGMSNEGYPSQEEAMAAVGGALPADWEILFQVEDARSQRMAQGRRGQTAPAAPAVKPAEAKPVRWYVVENRIYVDGKDVIDAYVRPSELTNSPQVHFNLNTPGGEAFYQLTSKVIDESRLMAIVLDRKVIQVLGSETKIAGGSAFINGSYTEEEANDLARQLKSGALRASMKTLEEKAMGPGLGADAIKAGIFGSALGFGAIIIFMVLWYHWSGVNAIVALTVNTIVMMGLMGSLDAVLTLPGIAGFALTLGMAVDANILIYERIREELDAGKSVSGAIAAGFDRVFWTIVDSHVTQLAAALLLYSFGTTAVKGFAVTLTIGVVASLFTSIYISRYIYDWILERHPNAKSISIGTWSVFKHTRFPFMNYKGTALAIGWSIILACAVAAQPWKGQDSKVKLGMEFVGGVDSMFSFKGNMQPEKVRSALYQAGLHEAAVVAYDYDKDKDAREFSIKLRAVKGQDAKDATTQFQQILGALKTLDPEAKDARRDLNLEGSLTQHWIDKNPLGVQGDDEARRAAYGPWAQKIVDVRDKTLSSPIRSFQQLPQDLPAQLKADLEQHFRLGPTTVLKSESFSPSISGEWTQKTLIAVGLALGAILLYVMMRFTTAFAVGGIVALIHDLLMSIGLFILFGLEFSVPVVASFLILMGYSMSDTIVVFDRIRENMRKPEYRRVPVAKLIDDSINQTLSRTILTSCSVLFVACCLFFWGGPALRDLSFPLLIGVITGTYSSIYIASPVVVYWDKWFGGRDGMKHH